jgi:hypothetical protein
VLESFIRRVAARANEDAYRLILANTPAKASAPIIMGIINAVEEAKAKLAYVTPARHMLIICHPDNLARFSDLVKKESHLSDAAGNVVALCGMEVRALPWVPLTSRKWVFPTERFVAYGKGDEAWAIPLGFGRWEESPVFYVVDESAFWL